MEPNRDIFELTQQYLHNRLSVAERESFEARFKNDEEFASEVERCKIEIEAIDHAGEEQLKQQFKTKFAAAQNRTRKSKTRKVWYAAAAVVLLLLTGIPISRMLQPGPSSEELFADYYEAPSFSGGRTGDHNQEWTKAATAYQNQQFETALPILLKLINQPDFDNHSETNLHIGICYLETKQYEKALNALAKVEAMSAYAHEAKWYTSLILLKNKKLDKATQLLKQLVNDKAPYFKDKATEILDRLD